MIEGVGWLLRTDTATWDWHSWGGVDWAALVVHLAWGCLGWQLGDQRTWGVLGGVGCSSIYSSALAV